MRRTLIALAIAALLVFTAACGGDKAATTAPTSTAAPTQNASAPATERAGATPTVAPDDESPDAQDSVGSILGSVLGAGLSGGAGSTGSGDETLKRFLPSAGDFPDGYTNIGEFTFSAPDGLSESGKIDVATSMATTGDITAETPDFSQLSFLMAMVLRPSDLQDLGGAFSQIKDAEKDEIESEIRSGLDDSGLVLENWRVLEADGLGEGGFGIELSLDLGELASVFGGLAPGGTIPSTMSMRMYLFGQGDYVGATLRMAFADALPDESDERALAGAMASKLQAE